MKVWSKLFLLSGMLAVVACGKMEPNRKSPHKGESDQAGAQTPVQIPVVPVKTPVQHPTQVPVQVPIVVCEKGCEPPVAPPPGIPVNNPGQVIPLPCGVGCEPPPVVPCGAQCQPEHKPLPYPYPCQNDCGIPQYPTYPDQKGGWNEHWTTVGCAIGGLFDLAQCDSSGIRIRININTRGDDGRFYTPCNDACNGGFYQPYDRVTTHASAFDLSFLAYRGQLAPHIDHGYATFCGKWSSRSISSRDVIFAAIALGRVDGRRVDQGYVAALEMQINSSCR